MKQLILFILVLPFLLSLKAEGLDLSKDLFKAMEENNPRRFGLFLRKGANPNTKDEAGNSLLHLVINHKNKKFFSVLMRYNPDLNIRDSKGNTPLHLASQVYNGFTQALILKGADVNAKNEEGKTPLHLASSFGRVINNIKMLIEAKADVNAKDNKGRTPLYFAALNKSEVFSNSSRSISKTLVANGADPNLADKKGESSLVQALKLERINLANFFISHGADLSKLDQFIINQFGTDFLNKLPEDLNQKLELIAKEISRSRELKQKALKDKKNPISLFKDKDLFKAMEEDNFRKFISLIKKGANPNVKDESGNSLLHRSIKHINKKFFQILIEHNADISARDSKGNTPLHLASQIHNGFTKALVSKGADVNAKNEEGKTPLHLASSSGRVINNIKILIEAGAKLNLKDSDGKTPLHLAISNKNDIKLANQSVARLLVESGADPNALDKRGVSPLMESINLHKISISRFLLAHGADILGFNQFIINNMGESFFNTLPVDPIEKLEVFIRKIYQENQGAERRVKKSPKASFTEKDLFKAMEENNLRKFSRILQKGLSPNAKDESGNSLLHLSLDHKNKGFFKALMEHDVDVNAKDGKGNTPLHKAVKKIRLVFTETLIKKGADPNAINESGQSPLHIASSSGRMINNIKILIEEKADINMQDNEGKTPLHLAILNKGDISLSTKQSVAKFLIKNGAKLNTLDKDGISPFIQALKLERVNLSRILLSHGADVSKLDQFISDQFGTDFLNRLPKDLNQKLELTFRQINRLHQIRGKPKKEGENILFTEKDLFKVMEENNLRQFKILLAKGLSPNAKDESGNSLLHLSLDHKNKGFFKALMEHDVDVNAKDEKGNTPLHKAVKKARLSFSRNLIKKGADVNAKNEEGKTPLHEAVSSGRMMDNIKSLIDAEADINMQDNEGKTPLHLATLNTYSRLLPFNDSVANVLIQNGADPNLVDKDGRSVLMEAVKFHQINLSKALVQKGADVNLKDQEGKDALIESLSLKYTFLSELFLSHGADVSRLNQFIINQLGIDYFNKLPDDPIQKLKIFTRKSYKIDPRKKAKKTNPKKKQTKDSSKLEKKLKEDGFYREESSLKIKKTKASAKNKLLFKAMAENDLTSFKDLIESGSNPNAKDEAGNSLLHLSIEHQSTGFFMFLMSLSIKNKIDINVLDAEKNTPLHWAALEADPYYTEVLTDFMASPNKKNEIGKTPLHFASSFGEKGIDHMNVLLQTNLDPNEQDEKGKTPLHYAILSGSFNKVKLLIKAKADPNIKDINGLSPLHELSQMKVSESMLKRQMLSEILKLLIKKGANVNGLDDLKQSPLMKALEAGNKPIAESLIKYGAHLFAADKYGKAVLDFCLKDHLREFIKGELEKQTELNRSKAPNKTGLRFSPRSVRK